MRQRVRKRPSGTGHYHDIRTYLIIETYRRRKGKADEKSNARRCRRDLLSLFQSVRPSRSLFSLRECESCIYIDNRLVSGGGKPFLSVEEKISIAAMTFIFAPGCVPAAVPLKNCVFAKLAPSAQAVLLSDSRSKEDEN